MKRLLPVLIAGFVAGLIEIIPVVKSFTCCILIPIATYYAMTLEIKGNKKETPFTVSEGLRFGVLTGIFGAFFATFFVAVFLAAVFLVTFFAGDDSLRAAFTFSNSLLRFKYCLRRLRLMAFLCCWLIGND